MPSERRSRPPARTLPARSVVGIPSNSMVASSMRFEVGKIDQVWVPVKDWQKECYRHFDICGEARFAARFFGNALSRAVLGVGQMQRDNTSKPVTTGPSVAFLDQLFNGQAGQSQMLAAIGVHLTIAGECWLVGRTVEGEDVWEVVSVLEMEHSGSTWTIDYGDNKAKITLSNSDVPIRIWLPHPARRVEADSPFRALLPVLGEIESLTRHIFAQTRSRLATAGILAVPSEATFPTAPISPEATKVNKTTNDLDAFMRLLAATAAASLRDQGDPASLVPIMMKMPGEHIDKMKLLRFWSELDAGAQTMRDDALNRFFLGMDLPPEQMRGMSSNSGTGGGRSNGISHWGAWQVEEQTLKMHVEPMLEVITNALTLSYLRPLTENLDVVTYSTEALRLRPDRSEPAIVLNGMGVLKDEVMVKENGFKPEDMMNEADQKQWLLRKVATGSNTPEQVAAALRALGLDMPIGDNSAPRQAPLDPTRENLPNRPRTPEAANLLPTAEALVLQALGRAGNRIRSRFDVRVPGVPAYETHTLHACNGTAAEMLNDAFPTAPIVLNGLGDVEKITQTLHAYCRSLMAEQKPHDRERLRTFLEVAGC